ncbi:hypothetical protein [Pseudophaeobacter sp.]|uniref:hypothetical protein n=1 Tax=Pseudophaeobacter sp. TaxID=1971739 RepID=UPI0026218F18|nr:hypothetical protein [Pseudophaeobacter sp.]
MNFSKKLMPMMFALSLMIMGMAGLPIEFLGDDKPSPHIVTGLRLAFVGVLATTIGVITGRKNPLNTAFSRTDVRSLFVFIGLAVFCVNGSLTYALFFLDDRMAMAIMFVAIGAVYVAHDSRSWVAWMVAALAVGGTALLASDNTTDIEFNMYGITFAAIGGAAQGFMFFKKGLMPKNVDPGIALGMSFLLGGLFMIFVSVFLAPIANPLIAMPNLLVAMLASALMTVMGWLILGYFPEKMSGAQKTGAASMEPVGAAITQYVILGTPLLSELIGVVMLVLSAAMAVFLTKKQ